MKLRVIDVTGKQEIYCGDYEFSTLPSRDDRIVVEKPDWGKRYLRVLYLVHLPEKYERNENVPSGIHTCVSVVGEKDDR